MRRLVKVALILGIILQWLLAGLMFLNIKLDETYVIYTPHFPLSADGVSSFAQMLNDRIHGIYNTFFVVLLWNTIMAVLVARYYFGHQTSAGTESK